MNDFSAALQMLLGIDIAAIPGYAEFEQDVTDYTMKAAKGRAVEDLSEEEYQQLLSDVSEYTSTHVFAGCVAKHLLAQVLENAPSIED